MSEIKIKKQLVDLQSAISSADGEALAAALRELDLWVVSHGGEIDPQLRHFLKNRSYEKALAYLSGVEDIPPGICGGGKR